MTSSKPALEILGHRGARGEAPENTLTGFNHLRRLGLRGVELDIQVAGDGSLVVIHDDTVDRTTNATGHLRQFDAAQLALLDACHHRMYPDETRGEISWPVAEGIPTLREVLEVLADFQHIQLEVKAREPVDVEAVIRQLPGLCQHFGHRVITTSFNTGYLAGIRREAPWISRGLLVESDFKEDMVELAIELGCLSIGPHFSHCTPELVASAHRSGIRISPWTVNAPEDMRRLHALGVDSLITDYPSLAIRLFGSDSPSGAPLPGAVCTDGSL